MADKLFYRATRRFKRFWAWIDHTSAKAQGKSERDSAFLFSFFGDLLTQSKAQHHQDLVAAFVHSFKRGGYFVEFGAADGINDSNTYFLETVLGWDGILAEPARARQAALLSSNRRATIDQRCVWSRSGEKLSFREAKATDLSTLDQFADHDRWAKRRRDGVVYEVESVSLLDLLREHQAPRTIDFLSIDTEGSEYEILQAFDFDAYDVRLICSEHNFGPRRADVIDLLSEQGFQRHYENLPGADDWFVKKGLTPPF